MANTSCMDCGRSWDKGLPPFKQLHCDTCVIEKKRRMRLVEKKEAAVAENWYARWLREIDEEAEREGISVDDVKKARGEKEISLWRGY